MLVERAIWLALVLGMFWWLLDLYASASGGVIVRVVVAVIILFLICLALTRGFTYH